MPCKDRKISTKILEQHLSEGKKQMNVLVLTKKSLVHQFKTVGSEIIGELRPGDEFPLVRQLHYDINRWVKTILPKQRKQDVSLL